MRKIKIVLVALFAVLSLSTVALAVNCPILDTGQTKCYGNTQEITCPSPDEDFYGQDAQYPCNPQSYTKLDENGNDLPDTATEWVMVRDNVTGLIWENKTDDSSIHDKDNYYNWYGAQDVFIATLNSQNFGGYSDWRLPTVKELSFLVDKGRYNPAINATYFPNTVSSFYWSSTTIAGSTGNAWRVHFYSGDTAGGHKTYDDGYVRAVHGVQCGPFDNFIDNGDGTVTNTDTGLMWELKTDDGGNRDKDNVYTWQQALSYCENLDLAGYDDWRLPNVNELQSLVDYTRCNPSINTTYFPNTLSSYYRSSTPTASNPGGAWDVSFDPGYLGRHGKSDYYGYVRAVRAGQCESFSTTTTIPGSTTTSTSISTTTSIYNPPPPPKTTTTTIIKVTSSSTSSTTTSTSIKPTTTTTILVPVPTSTSSINSTTTTIMPICLIEQIYGDNSDEVRKLRFIRDSFLNQTPEGQAIIRLYYEWSPMIVRMMEEDEEFKAQLKEMIDGALELIISK